MRIVICRDYDRMSRAAAAMIGGVIGRRKELVLGLATGATPRGLYSRLAEMYARGEISFRQVTTFNLDEYHGLAPDHPQSYRSYMNRHLFDLVDIDREKTFLPDGLAADFRQQCAAYEARIAAAGGLDLQVLGIGGDGHIGFNEPGSSLGSRTRLVVLDQQTVTDNARFFDAAARVPRYALTMGVGTILEARQLVMLASGANKAAVVARALEGPLTSQVTASALQLHPEVTVFLDEAAAGALARGEQYRASEAAWQQLTGAAGAEEVS